MRDESGEVLYVGKASNLRQRLRSYFSNSPDLIPKIRTLVSKVTNFDFIVTESDQEAVILECNLIKEHKPRYNARLKDDKSYPFIKIDISENYPLVYITRRVLNDGARYFGPFASARSVRKTLSLLKKLFPYRSCTKEITGNDERACLDYYIRRCVGPCIGAVDKDEYASIIDQVILFLEGKTEHVVNSITVNMKRASDSLDFERAAMFRDQLKSIQSITEEQKVLHVSKDNMDLIAIAIERRRALVEIFFVRHGKLIGRDNFAMDGVDGEEPSKIITAFVKQFYDSTVYVPSKIFLQYQLDDVETIRQWLMEKRSGQVTIQIPQRGYKAKMMKMVARNAIQGLAQMKIRQLSTDANIDIAMNELQEALSLPRSPSRIEGYDISNISGTNSVGSMVVFENGISKPSKYRRFKVKTVDGIDDYSMMREVLTRRFKRLRKNVSADPNDLTDLQIQNTKTDQTWRVIPDLVLIDGGKGHLSVALQVFLELGIDFIPLVSLAKENEELFVPYVAEAIVLPRGSQGLFLVERIRDEAHRFAVTFHRQKRSIKQRVSVIDSVPGIGPKRRQKLLRTFGSLAGLKQASLEDIVSVPGMTLSMAQKIKESV